MQRVGMVLLLSFCSSFSLAQEKWQQEIRKTKATQAINLCEKARNDTTAATSECYRTEYERADLRLNQIYSEYRKTLSKPHREMLLKAQRGWMTFKDQHCQVVGSQYEGGSWQSILSTQCLIDETNRRNVQLLQLHYCDMELIKGVCD